MCGDADGAAPLPVEIVSGPQARPAVRASHANAEVASSSLSLAPGRRTTAGLDLVSGGRANVAGRVANLVRRGTEWTSPVRPGQGGPRGAEGAAPQSRSCRPNR